MGSLIPQLNARRALSLCHLPVGFDTKKGFFQVFTGPSLDFLIFVSHRRGPPTGSNAGGVMVMRLEQAQDFG